MRILEIETFGRGGLTHYAYNLSAALADRGHEVTLATHAAYELEEGDRPAPFPVLKVMGRWTHRAPSWLPRFALNLMRKVEAIYDGFALAATARRLRPDVVHVHCTNPVALLYLKLLRRRGRPLVATAHVVTPHERIPFQTAVYRRLHGTGELVIAHSRVDRQRLLDEFAVREERVTVIPHGDYGFFEGADAAPRAPAAARESLGLAPDDEVALFFGYVREYKGLDLLLDAWPAVAKARPKARLVVAGDPVRLPPARRAELEAAAERIGAILHFGYIPFSEVTTYFDAADALVMPYRHISQSGVLFLALSVGVPVIATQVGALPEMLDDGDSALLVPPESTAALADALVRALGDPGLRARLAAGGRRVAADHSWDSIAVRTEKAFATLLDPAETPLAAATAQPPRSR
ncbi:MAG: glycosyltransferase family 4 protein [Planctomycetota bacterium]